MIKTAQQKRNAKGLQVGTMQSATTVLLDGSSTSVTVKPTYSGAANGDRVAVQRIRGRQYIAFLMSPPQAPLVLETEWFNLGEKDVNGNANPAMGSAYIAYDDAFNYAPARFRRDAFGVVQLSGLIKPTSGTQPTLPYTLFTLPVGFRPSVSLLFQAACNGAAVGIEVTAAGAVIVSSVNGTSADTGFMALDGVNFVTEDLPGFTPVFHNITTFTNSWVNFGSGFAPARYWIDPDGFVHLSGVVKSGANTGPMFTIPAPYWPDFQEIFQCYSNAGTCRVDVTTTGGVNPSTYSTGGSNASVSLDGIICGTGTNQWPKWHTQNAQIPFLGSWAYYGTPFANARYCVDRAGNVHWSGLVKSGSSGVSLLTTPLPAAIFPQYHLIFLGSANAGMIREDIWWNPVVNANNVNMVGYYQGGTNAFASLCGIYYSLK